MLSISQLTTRFIHRIGSISMIKGKKRLSFSAFDQKYRFFVASNTAVSFFTGVIKVLKEKRID